jgi:L-ascorbate metabolism protein UlaG (beta-lactamase superfamily)
MKIAVIILVVILLLSFLYFWIEVRPRFGNTPKGKYFDQIASSPNFDREKKKFVNFQEDLVVEAEKNSDNWKIMKEFIFPKNQVTPKTKLPEVIPDLDAFMSAQGGIQFIWLGHSTFLLKINNKILLVDPVFSKSASPLDFLTPRYQPPVIKQNDLPRIDAIVISHDHYDHLDSRTIESFKQSTVRFFVPLGVSSHLERWGIQNSRITELDWWGTSKWEGIDFICTPAQHFSGRVKPYGNKTLWSSWVVKTETENIYYSGDSGYGPHFKEIGDKYGPFDISLIENGQYDDQWRPIHVHPDEAAQAYFDLKSKALIPVHWGMFTMAMHNWYDPIEALAEISKKRGINLLTPKIGQLIDLKSPGELEPWWKRILPTPH